MRERKNVMAMNKVTSVIARSKEDSFALLGTGCAISYYKHVEIATLPPVARNDNFFTEKKWIRNGAWLHFM